VHYSSSILEDFSFVLLIPLILNDSSSLPADIAKKGADEGGIIELDYIEFYDCNVEFLLTKVELFGPPFLRLITPIILDRSLLFPRSITLYFSFYFLAKV
jgi:hypothetical protein